MSKKEFNLLTIYNSFLLLSSNNIWLLNDIYDALTFKDNSSAFYNGQFRPERVKTVNFAKFEKDLELATLNIPIGFLYFIDNLKIENLKIIDKRKVSSLVEFENIKLKGITLKDYQIEALKKLSSKYRGIIMAPPGAGKTEIFLTLLKSLQTNSLVLFNRQQLAFQTFERAKTRGLDPGYVQGKNVLEKDVTIATIQSINKIENIKKYKNLIIDEVHNARSNSYQKILKLKHWERVYGFSATPINLDKINFNSAKIVSFVGPIIYRLKPEKLINDKVIAKPSIRIIKINKPDDIGNWDYTIAERLGIINNKYRNNVIKKLVEKHQDDKVLILTKYVNQGKLIQNILPDAPFIYHEFKVKDRLKIIDDFENNKFNVLIASRILDEGIDIKNFKVLIIASAGLSFVKTIQRLGRGLRISKNKDKVIIYDFLDETHHVLLRHSRERIRTYNRFGYKDIEILEGVTE